jgi:hypothetical protein
MVREKWSEFQLANKKDEEEGYGGNSGEESWKKVVVAIILDGLGKYLHRELRRSWLISSPRPGGQGGTGVCLHLIIRRFELTLQ